MSAPGLATHIRAVSAGIDPSSKSTTKWNPVRDLLAEALNLNEDDVYVSTVSKPGNLSVRGDQSGGSRATDVFAGMYTGQMGQLGRCVTAAAKHGDGRLMLLFTGAPGSWTLAAIVKPRGQAVPAALAAEYPTASVVNY
jgi:hypothetical protein